MSNCRQPGRDARAQAESQAQAIIAQGRRQDSYRPYEYVPGRDRYWAPHHPRNIERFFFVLYPAGHQ